MNLDGVCGPCANKSKQRTQDEIDAGENKQQQNNQQPSALDGESANAIADDASPSSAPANSSPGMAYHQDDAHNRGYDDDASGYDNKDLAGAKGGEQGDDDFQDKHHSAPQNKDDPLSGSPSDKDKPADSEKKDDKDKKLVGSEQETFNKKDKGDPNEDEKEPPEGWFRWLESFWDRLYKHEQARPICNLLNPLVMNGITAASAGFGATLKLYLGYTTNTIGALFNILNDMENPLFYTGLIFVKLNGVLPVLGPLIFGGPAAMVYAAMQPVDKFRSVINFVLKFPPINELLKKLRKLANQLLKSKNLRDAKNAVNRFKQAGGIKSGTKAVAKGYAKDKVGDAKNAVVGAARAVKNAPKNAVKAAKKKAKEAKKAIKKAGQSAAAAGKKFKDRMGDARKNIGKGISSAKAGAKGAVKSAGRNLAAAGKKVKNIPNNARKAAGVAGNKFKNAGKGIASKAKAAKESIGKAGQGIKDGLGKAGQGIKGGLDKAGQSLSKVPGNIGKGLSSAKENIGKGLSSAKTGAGNAVKAAGRGLSAAGKKARNIPKNARKAAGVAGNKFRNAGRNAGKGIASGARAAKAGLGKGLTAAGQGIKNTAGKVNEKLQNSAQKGLDSVLQARRDSLNKDGSNKEDVAARNAEAARLENQQPPDDEYADFGDLNIDED